jgi:hypothetical protein
LGRCLMSYEEKGTWVYVTVAVMVYAAYLVIILDRLAGGSVATMPYVSTLLWSIGASMAASIVGRIVFEIAKPSDSYTSDARDKEINRFGEHIGQGALIAGALAALVLAMAEVDYFWIANAIYLGFVASAVIGSVTKLVAYRRGF